MFRVLVVDDDITMRHLIVQQLDLLEVAADSAAGGMEAIRRVQVFQYELVLMDWEMPDMDGRDAVAAIRSFETRTGRNPVPVVTITGSRVTSKMTEELGMQDAYQKPLLMDDIKGIVRKWLPDSKVESA